MAILFISKRNNHGKYFKLLISKTNIDAEIHYMGLPTITSFLYFWMSSPILLTKVVSRQLERKRHVYPKLLSISFNRYIYRFFLYCFEKFRMAKFHTLLKAKSPDYIAIWNGDKSPYHSLVLLAKHLKIKIIYFENGLLPGTTTIDFHGVNAKSSLPTSPSFYQNYHKQFPLQVALPKLRQRPNHKKRPTEPHIELPQKYLFIPLQVPNDTQIVVNSPTIKSMEQLFYLLVNSWQKSLFSDHQLIFKAHPSWPNDFKHLIDSEQKNIHFANGNNTDELIKGATAVITINSTVGIEALLHRKPVLTLGDACYNIPGLVLHSVNNQSFIQTLNTLKNWRPDDITLDGFLAFLLQVYCIPNRWSQAQSVHFQSAARRLQQCDSYFEFSNTPFSFDKSKDSLKLNKTVNF